MNGIDLTEETVWSIAAVVVGLLLLRVVWRALFGAKPPEKFRCARCRREFDHDDRTTEAWRTGKHKFFCPECHRKWRESHPAVRESRGGVGCLSVLTLILSFFAFGAYAAVRHIWAS